MPRWRERQQVFAQALLAAEQGVFAVVPSGVVDPRGQPSFRRFDVYRNNVAVGLIESLEAAYPAVRRLVGDEFFREMARRYAVEHPPDSPVMAFYGKGFPAFIADFEPAASLVYLRDVARIERSYLEAYHAAEATALNPEILRTVAPDRYAELRFIAHPSVRLVPSPFPARTIWRMNIADGVPAPVDLANGETTLIVRPESEVEVRDVPCAGATFLLALLRGESLGVAAARALKSDGTFDLAMHLQGLLESGIFSACRLAKPPKRGGRRGETEQSFGSGDLDDQRI